MWRTIDRLVSEGATLSGLGTLVVLVAFLSLFGLKAAGARFLRWSCPKASLVAFVVCCGLAHGEDVAQWAKDPAHVQAVSAITATAVVGTGLVLRRRVAKRVTELLIRLRDLVRAILLPEMRVAVAAHESRRRGPPHVPDRPRVPRGPPKLNR